MMRERTYKQINCPKCGETQGSEVRVNKPGQAEVCDECGKCGLKFNMRKERTWQEPT